MINPRFIESNINFERVHASQNGSTLHNLGPKLCRETRHIYSNFWWKMMEGRIRKERQEKKRRIASSDFEHGQFLRSADPDSRLNKQRERAEAILRVLG